MNTRYALVALLSLIPATLFAADKAPSSKAASADVATSQSDDASTPSTPALLIPKHVQAVNFDGSTGFPVLTANDWAVFQDAAAVGSLLADLDGNKIINANDYQTLMDRMAVAYIWQNSVIVTMPQIN